MHCQADTHFIRAPSRPAPRTLGTPLGTDTEINKDRPRRGRQMGKPRWHKGTQNGQKGTGRGQTNQSGPVSVTINLQGCLVWSKQSCFCLFESIFFKLEDLSISSEFLAFPKKPEAGATVSLRWHLASISHPLEVGGGPTTPYCHPTGREGQLLKVDILATSLFHVIGLVPRGTWVRGLRTQGPEEGFTWEP